MRATEPVVSGGCLCSASDAGCSRRHAVRILLWTPAPAPNCTATQAIQIQFSLRGALEAFAQAQPVNVASNLAIGS